MLPKVSVCITVYNHEPYIVDCVRSVLAQEADAELEILVGDDASRDRSWDLLQRLQALHPERLKVFRHTPNIGAARNYQELIARATGEFVAHLDGDDYWLPGKLRAQLRFLAEHVDCVGACTNAMVVSADGRLAGGFTRAHPSTIDATYLLTRGNFLNHSSLLYRRVARDSLLLLKAPFIDYRMYVELCRLGRLGFVDEALVVYRRGTSGSMVRTVPNEVKECYREAVQIGLGQLDAVGARNTLAHFMASAILSDVFRARKPDLWRVRWALKASGDAKVGVVLRSFAITWGLLFGGLRSMLAAALSGYSLSVLHPRR